MGQGRLPSRHSRFYWFRYFFIEMAPMVLNLRPTFAQNYLILSVGSCLSGQVCLPLLSLDVCSFLLSAILQRGYWKRFYLKRTVFASKGLGFALCQPDIFQLQLAAMKREDLVAVRV
jgi:hypothetical protein